MGGDEQWDSHAEKFFRALSQELSATLKARKLTAGLLEFRLTSAVEGTAEIRVVVSSTEVILSAGRGTRFELEELAGSEARISSLVRAVARGGLTEFIWPKRVTFELELEGGEVLHGGTRKGLPRQRGNATRVAYGSFVTS
jgi:hypothetical protein